MHKKPVLLGILLVLIISSGALFAEEDSSKKAEPLLDWDIVAIVKAANPSEVLKGNVKQYTGAPGGTICGFEGEGTGGGTLSVDMSDRSEFEAIRAEYEKDGGYTIQDEPGLGEQAFSAVEDNGTPVIIFVAIKSVKTVRVRFVGSNPNMNKLRQFTKRVLDGF